MRRITVNRIRRGIARLGREAVDWVQHPGSVRKGAALGGYEEWRDGLARSGEELFPAGWTQHIRPRGSDGVRVAAVMHVHFPELVPELLDHLSRIPVPFDLFVTNSSGQALAINSASLPQLDQLHVLNVENHGRDIFPLIQLINAGLLAPYELVCKVHTKKSAWRAGHDLAGSGDVWKNDLLDALLSDSERVESLLQEFDSDDTLGQVTAPGSILGRDYWGANFAPTKELLRRVGLVVKRSQLTFCAGSMYWTRASILGELRALRLSRADFEEEMGQVDGTTAHAVERAIGLLAAESGFRLAAVT